MQRSNIAADLGPICVGFPFIPCQPSDASKGKKKLLSGSFRILFLIAAWKDSKFFTVFSVFKIEFGRTRD